MIRDTVLEWLNEKGSTPELVWSKAEKMMDVEFEKERTSKDRSQDWTMMQTALMNSFLRGITTVKTMWDWLAEKEKTEGVPPLWERYNETGKIRDAIHVRTIFLNGLANLRRESFGQYNPVPQFFSGKVGPENNNKINTQNRWVGGMRYPEILKWAHEEVAPLCGQSIKDFDASWRPNCDIDDFIRAVAEEQGAKLEPDGNGHMVYMLDGQPFTIATEDVERYGQYGQMDLESLNERARGSVMSMAAEREANEQNSIEHERLPTEEDIEQIINPIYQQEVLAKESLLLERIAHDVWGWRKNKKLPLTGLVKSAVGATPTALLRGVSQRFDENNHVADLLVRHKILSECGDGTTVRELTECADRVVKDGARKRMCLWQLSLLDIAEKQLGIKENRPSRAFGQQRFEEFQPQQGSEKTITHHNLERCIKHLSDRTQEIAAAGEDGQRLAEFQKEKPEAFELFQELERRYGSSPERVEKRLKELDPVEPERFWVDGYSTTRRAKAHLSELLCQKLHKAITQNQKWSDKARDMGETCHAYYEELQDHFKKIGYQPKNDPEYQRVHDQIAQRREHCLKNNLAQSKDEKLQHLLQKQQNLVEAITNAKPDRYPNYKEMKQQMREQLEKWTRETILNEREATNRSTPEGREAIEMLLKETKTVLEGGSSRSGIYRGKRLDYDEGSKQLWRAHLKNFDRSIEAIFPKEGPFSTAHVKDELQKMNEVSVQAIGQNRIPKRLMQPPESKDVQEVINRQFWGGVGKRIATLDRQTFATILQEALDKGNDDYYTAHELDNEAPEELKGGIQIRPQFEKMAMELCKRTNPTVVQEILTQNLNYAETALETARPLNEINRMNNVFDTVLTKDGRIHTTIYRVGGRGLLQGKPIHYTSRPAAETIGKDIELDDIELTRENREREAEARTR